MSFKSPEAKTNPMFLKMAMETFELGGFTEVPPD